MAEINTRGKPFDNREGDTRYYSAIDDRTIIKHLSGNCVGGQDDLVVTSSGNTLSVSPGYCVVEGVCRQFDNSTTFTVGASQLGYVVVELNDEPGNGSVSLKVASQTDSFPALIKTSTLYQTPLASFATDVSGRVINVLDMRKQTKGSTFDASLDYKNTDFNQFMNGFTSSHKSVFEPMYNAGPNIGELASSMFLGGVLAPNGKVIFAPLGSTKIGIYDPIVNSYANGPSVGSAVSLFSGCVLAPNGKVILVPNASQNVGIYDPMKNTFANGPSVGGNKFRCGVLAPNGKVVFLPSFDSSYIGIYDPVANSYATGPNTGAGGFFGGVLAPNGKVILVPNDGTKIGIYDPIANSYADGPDTELGEFSGGVLAPNGKVILVPDPSNNPNIGIYDPVANTYTKGPAVPDTGGSFGLGQFTGGVLCPSGKIIFAPRNRTYFGIYDTVSNSYATGPATDMYGFAGGVLVPNGKVILVPNSAERVGIYDLMGGDISRAYCMHPYLNTL